MTISRSFANVLLVSMLATPLAAQSAGPMEIVPRSQVTASGTSRFGSWMSLSGDDLLARDYGSTSRAYVFHRTAGAWSHQADFAIQSTDLTPCYGFATNLSIAGDRLAIGEAFHGSTGRVTISDRVGSTWGPPQYVEDQNVDGFGNSVLLIRGLLLVGAPDDLAPGYVEFFRRQAAGWQWTGILPSPPPPVDYGFGTLMAASGNTFLAASSHSVKAYLQGASPASWTFQANLVPSGDAIVSGIAIDGDVAVVATRNTPSCGGSPEVVVFERTGTSWSQTASLAAADSAPPELGTSLAVVGDTIWVGAKTHSEGSSIGAVYVFQRLGGAWTQTSKLRASPALGPGISFGASLARSGTTLSVGAPGTALSDPGEVQVFDVVSLPAPSSYCTAKVNSLGCLPQMSASGVPGATNPNPFLLQATNVMNNKVGILLYSSAGSAATPYQGGILCLAPQIRRTPGQMSGGNPPPNDCSGTYSFDFNARVQSGVDPALVPGRQVWAQYYSRDPGDPFLVGLTDAVTFTIGS